LKHFKLVGPKTTREFDIEDDEMIVSHIIKIIDYESPTRQCVETTSNSLNEQNVKIYPTLGDIIND